MTDSQQNNPAYVYDYVSVFNIKSNGVNPESYPAKRRSKLDPCFSILEQYSGLHELYLE